MIDLKLNPSCKELRLFAAMQIAFFALIAFLLWRKNSIVDTTAWYIVGVSVVTGIAGLLWPAFIRVVYVAWMIAVFPIGWTISHAVLAVVFYLVVTPIGWMLRLSGRDPMQRKFDAQAKTYWQPRTAKPTDRYFRQF